MANFTGNAIVAKAKAMFGQRLKEKDYLELIKKKNLSEVVGYLKTLPSYQTAFESISEQLIRRSQLEHVIKENNFNVMLRLIKFATLKDASFYELYLVKMASDLILDAIRSIISPEDDTIIPNVPAYFLTHAPFDIKRVSEAKTMKELLGALEKTPYYKVIAPFSMVDNENIRYVEIENALEVFYYDSAFKRIDDNYKGRIREDLRTIFMTRIELSNIIKIYRLKRFYRASPDVIRENLIRQYSRISEQQMNELIELDDPNAILKYLEKSSLARFTDRSEYVYVEYYADRIRYNLSKRYMYYSTIVPKVYSSFLFLREIEVENLINIIEGIRYQLQPVEIQPMLIY
ncbi:MAG: V-type ATPase subunit [Bacilli bacterium]|nr:V-type ATPase subunit [Bacilli bacterium]